MALTDNLEAYYKLNDTPNDEQSNHNGTEGGGLSYRASRIDNGAYFDGDSNYITIGAGLSFGTSDYTIAFWGRMNTALSDNGADGSRMMSKEAVDVNTEAGEWAIRYAASGNPSITINLDGTSYTCLGNGNVFDNDAYAHCVILIDRSTELRWYLNSSSNQGADISAGSAHTLGGTAANLWFGGREQGGGSSFWWGELDEISFWSRLLTEAEITEIYNGGAGKELDAIAVPVFMHHLTKNIGSV